MNEASIEKYLKTDWLGRNNGIIYFEEIDSTNEELKRRWASGVQEGLIAVADHQAAGKGRRGRSWSDRPGENIAMSFLIKPDLKPDLAPMMTLLMALSTLEAIESVTGAECRIKWPNDIVLKGKKLVGILTEMELKEGRIEYVIIGTGINVNLSEIPEELKNTATSLYLQTGKKWERSLIAAECNNYFESNYSLFLRSGDLSAFTDEYNRRSVNFGERVRVLDPKGEYEGNAEGIDEKGNLIVKKDSGEKVKVYSGEVSVRGIYGYV